MKKVVRDDRDSMKFMVVLTEDDPIVLDSAQREEVITELQIFWRTDVMVRCPPTLIRAAHPPTPVPLTPLLRRFGSGGPRLCQ